MTKRVIVDAGHGGKDPGSVANGLQEKNIALVISKSVANELNTNYEGVEVILTRSTDVFLELKERTNLANKKGADILVSIHCNAGGGAGGFESFTYNQTSNKATAALQNVLHTEIMAQLQKYGVTDRGQKKENLHMCRESKMPAVLTENLFIDVVSDATKLKNDKVIQALVTGHVNGMAKYLGLTKKEQVAADNSVTIYVNDVQIGKGDIVDGVTRAPVRALAQAFGAQVLYDSKNKKLNIFTIK